MQQDLCTVSFCVLSIKVIHDMSFNLKARSISVSEYLGSIDVFFVKRVSLFKESFRGQVYTVPLREVHSCSSLCM